MSRHRQERASDQRQAQPTGLLQRKCACGNHTIAGDECASCRQSRLLQRAPASAAPAPAVPPIVDEVLRSPGQPLDAATRAFMEPRFGQDFGDVQIHIDAAAAESASAVDAAAYTVGRDVVFGQGQYQPQSATGQGLIAHELAHVVQQGIAEPQGVGVEIDRSSTRETEARQAGVQAAAGTGAVQISTGAELGLARKPLALDQSLDPQKMSDEEVKQEIEESNQWLAENPGASSDRALIEKNLRILTQVAAQRMLVSYQRRYGETMKGVTPNALGAAYQAASLSAGFTGGFLVGAQQAIPADAWATLENELRVPMNNIAFNLGGQVGLPLGAFSSLWDNISGLFELASMLIIGYLRFFTLPGVAREIYEHVTEAKQDPRSYGDQWRAKVVFLQEIVTGLKEFITAYLTNPSFLLEQGYELGQIAGTSAGELYNQDFAPATPFAKGRMVGKAGGYVALELALLFLGPEEWALRGLSAGGKALKGGKAARAILEGMERVPGLQRILRARSGTGTAGKAGKVTGEAAEAGAKAGKADGAVAEAVKAGEKPADELVGEVGKVPAAGSVGEVKAEAPPTKLEQPPVEAAPTAAETQTGEIQVSDELRRAIEEHNRASAKQVSELTDPEINRAVDLAFEDGKVTRPTVRGGKSKPKIGGHRVSQNKRRRMDLDDLPRNQGETARAALARVQKVIHKKISDFPEVEQVWNKARDYILRDKQLDPANYDDLYTATRKRFWQEMRTKEHTTARKLFEDAGFEFPSGSTNAPLLRGVDPSIPEYEKQINLDHIEEKARVWQRALDASNLKFEFGGPNTFRETIQARHPELRSIK